ncbi:MAG: hypothetical protein SF028_06325 [Candidatus Sumerlaeia bacterium]|nr:hypothetical protein [Candidatus Sumerlaeia bacterium]
MIRFARVTLSTFSFVILFVLGLDWLLDAAILEPVFPNLTGYTLLRSLPLEGRIAIGSAAVLLPLGVASLALLEAGLGQGIRVQRAGLRVTVRPEAFEAPLRRQLEGKVDGLESVEPLIDRASDGSPKVTLRLMVEEDADLETLQDEVRQRADAVVKRLTGKPCGDNLELVVRGFRKGRAESRRERRPRPDAARGAKGSRPRQPLLRDKKAAVVDEDE